MIRVVCEVVVLVGSVAAVLLFGAAAVVDLWAPEDRL